MKQGLGTGAREGYATALADLWSGLSHTLARLEEIAAEPDATLADEGVVAALPGLQYTLHAASEAAAGIDPPAGAEDSHAELAAALADARDATAEVAEAASSGGAFAAWPLVYEWRGALFRVRLARLRLGRRPVTGPAAPARTSSPARTTIVLATIGCLVIILGALFGLWPIAAAGLTMTAFAVLRGRP